MSAISESRFGSSEPPVTRYPLDYMDRGCLAATSAEHGSSNAPTWELLLSGAVTPDECAEALRLLLARHPSCAAWVRPNPAAEPKSHSLYYEVQSPVALERLFHYVDLREAADDALTKLRTEIRDRFIDVYREFPLHVTFAQIEDDSARLFFKQHHALADGRAFIEMLQDFAEFLENARTGQPISDARRDVYPRQDEFRALEIGRLKGILWGLAGLGIWLRIGWRLMRTPLTPLLENRSFDYRGSDGMLHLVLDRERLAHWRPLRQRAGISLSSLISGALCLASWRWNREAGIDPGRVKISLVAETRPRHGRFRSFANHLAGLMAEVELDQNPSPIEIMRSIQAQVRHQVTHNAHKKRLVFERAITANVPLDHLRKAVFEAEKPTANLNLSNLISLHFPQLRGEDWSVDAIEITTPVIPPFGVMLTVIDYNGKLRFNFNYKASVVTRDQVEKLRTYFQEALDEIAHALAQLPEASEESG